MNPLTWLSLISPATLLCLHVMLGVTGQGVLLVGCPVWPAALSAESSHRGEGRWPSRVAAVVTKAQVGPQEGNQGDVQPTEHTEGLCLLGLRADPLLGVGGCGADLGGSSSPLRDLFLWRRGTDPPDSGLG